MMNPEDLQEQEQGARDEVQPVNTGPRVFDISDDSISPVSSEVVDELMTGRPQTTTPRAVAPNEDTDKRAAPPRDEEMLDQRIGSFDMTPFAGAPTATTPPPARPPTPPVTPRPQTPPPSSPDLASYRETIDQRDLAGPNALPQERPKYTPPAQATQAPKPAPSPIPAPSTTPINRLSPTPAIPSTPATPNKSSLQSEIAQQLNTIRGLNPLPSTPVQPEPAPVTRPVRVPPPPPSVTPAVIKPVRTYEGDVAEAMSHKRASVASIAIAESKKQENTAAISNTQSANEPPSHAGRKALMLILALLLLGGGAYGAYYLYLKSALAPVTPIVPQQKAAPSIVPSDEQRVITLSSLTANNIHASVSGHLSGAQQANTVTELIFATKNAAGGLTRVSGPAMITGLNIDAPDMLTRSLRPGWMLGIYNDANNEKSVFVVATSDFFQNTFAGMLQWESVMPDDLRRFFSLPSVEGISNEIRPPTIPSNPALDNLNSILPTLGTPATTSDPRFSTTATSSPTQATSTTPATESSSPLRPYTTVRGTFEDRIIKNKDVRVFRTEGGDILFLYSFIDNTRLVVTDREATLTEIINRLEKQALIR